MRFKLQPSDVTTLHLAVDLAKKAGRDAAKACTKAELTAAASEGLELEGYADEAKLHLNQYVKGEVELQEGHLRACKTGLQLLFNQVRKTRETELELEIDTSGADDRMEQLRRVAARLKLNVQLELEEEEEAVGAV